MNAADCVGAIVRSWLESARESVVARKARIDGLTERLAVARRDLANEEARVARYELAIAELTPLAEAKGTEGSGT